MSSEQHFSLADAAERLGVSYETVYRWVRNGRLPAVQPNGRNGSWRVPESSFPKPPEPVAAGAPAPRPVTGEMQNIVRQLEERERQIKQLAG